VDVRDRISALRREIPARLRAMPPKHEEKDVFDGKSCSMITWHDEPSPGEHRIVVAAYVPSMMGLATRITADGFVLQADGSIRPLTPEELQSFQ